ncbi:restriction endonuclease subunit S [Maribacter sp. Asnod1-A12]|uniref:restriction endonuclease subunit S n=1 Tax=Maribacter sp. Asnod1-A12 TaxID=3160576 RepID=UPI00386ADD5E
MKGRYDSYKDSGVELIGEIPKEWIKTKLKYVSNICGRIGYRGYTVEDIVDEGEGVITISPSNIKEDQFSTENSTFLSWDKYYESPEIQIFPDDIILVKTGSTIGKTSIIPQGVPEMTINPQLVVLKKIKLFPKYFYYQTVCKYIKNSFDIEQTGSTTPTISQEKINDFPLLYPPVQEQQQIVQYLDTKTSLIDSLLKKTEKKIKLLKEQRTSLINEVVTKGLNPNVELKDSGVEWIGEIPSHWVVKPLKFIIENLNSGVSVNSENVPVEDENEMGILKTSSVYGNIFRPNENKKILITEYQRIKCSVLKDSIIISRMNTPQMVGSSGYIDRDYKNLFLPDRLWITEIFKGVDLSVKWLSYVLKSNKFRSELSSRSTGTSPSMKNITKSDLLTIRIPYLSLIEQQQIVDFLDKKTNLIDSTISIEEKRIEHLKEYRQSLISEVVTGKIKVTD